MRIGVFSDSYLPYTSGLVRSVQLFAEELGAQGHEIYIFAPRYANCHREERVFRFASVPSPTNPDYWLAIPLSWRLPRLLRRLGLDVVHVHSPFLLGRAGAYWARRLGIPLVFTYHTLYEHYVHYVPLGRRWTRALARHMSAKFCNACDLVLAPSASVADYLRSIGVRAPVEVLPTGIRLEEFAAADPAWLRATFGLGPEETILLCVCRLGLEKNLDFLLLAFREIAAVRPETRLVMVGGGPAAPALKRLAHELGLQEKVVFTGFLPREKVVSAYRGADLFVFSSVTETQGIVVAEAKAAGLPVVAVGAFGVSEMVNDGVDGFLTPPDVGQFRDRVLQLLDDGELRRAMAARGREAVESLSITNCTRRLVAWYEMLLRGRGRHVL